MDAALTGPALALLAMGVTADQLGGDRGLRKLQRQADRHPEVEDLRLQLAAGLLARNPEEGAWCAEARYLLEPLDSAELVPWAQTVRMHVNRRCGGPAWPIPEIGRELLDTGAWTEAEAQLAAVPVFADQQARAQADLLESRAALHFSVGEHEQATEALRKAILLDSTPDRRMRLGLSLMPLGEEVEARAQIAVGMLLDPTPTALYERAKIALDVLGTPEPTPTDPLPPGTAFPDLELDDNGELGRLSDHHGPLVVDLWATWCQPCLEAIPMLQDRAPAWHAKGVGLIGVNVDGQSEALARFKARSDPGYPTAWGGPEAMRAAELRALPGVFVLDRDHRVAGFVGGWTPGAQTRLEALVDSVSAVPPSQGNDDGPIGD